MKYLVSILFLFTQGLSFANDKTEPSAINLDDPNLKLYKSNPKSVKKNKATEGNYEADFLKSEKPMQNPQNPIEEIESKTNEKSNFENL